MVVVDLVLLKVWGRQAPYFRVGDGGHVVVLKTLSVVVAINVRVRQDLGPVIRRRRGFRRVRAHVVQRRRALGQRQLGLFQQLDGARLPVFISAVVLHGAVVGVRQVAVVTVDQDRNEVFITLSINLIPNHCLNTFGIPNVSTSISGSVSNYPYFFPKQETPVITAS